MQTFCLSKLFLKCEPPMIKLSLGKSLITTLMVSGETNTHKLTFQPKIVRIKLCDCLIGHWTAAKWLT